MDTQQPSPSSPNGSQSTPELESVHEEMKKQGMNPEALVMCVVGQNESIFGEVYDFPSYLVEDPETHEKVPASIFEKGDVVAVKNPKRFIRMNVQMGPGQMGFQLIFSDFDFIDGGVMEVKPTAAFFLSWLDADSQLRYCKAYLGWLDGKRKAQAKAAGLILPDSADGVQDTIQKIRDRMKG
jgi:hypothetical protein